MPKNKKRTKTPAPSIPPLDIEVDLENWQRAMAEAYVVEATTDTEGKARNLLINCTHHVALELRAIRRAIEAKPS